jgi:hypothetical protein
VAVRRVEVRNDLLLSFIYVSRQGAETPAAGILCKVVYVYIWRNAGS